MSLDSVAKEHSWGDNKWCKVLVNFDDEKSFCGHVIDYWWSLAGN